MISKTPQGRWRARHKQGREFVASRTFDTKREAAAWLTHERLTLSGVADVRAARQSVRSLLEAWLKVRQDTVASKTYTTDRALLRLIPTYLLNMQLGSVTEREVSRSFETLIRSGLAERSVVRYRASLSSFFAWTVRENIRTQNPVTTTRVPRSSSPTTPMLPWTEAELENAYLRWLEHDPRLADIMLILGWTGLRWGEARDLEVGDLTTDPSPVLVVRHNRPEGVERKTTKSRRPRRVPVANRVLHLLLAMAEGKEDHDLLLTTNSGSRLHRTAVVRTLKWADTAQGRRIHDLRHTAACLFIARGVDLTTVMAWMGHSQLSTTAIYLHHLGSAADEAGLARLNGK